jgi:hypothetical protein
VRLTKNGKRWGRPPTKLVEEPLDLVAPLDKAMARRREQERLARRLQYQSGMCKLAEIVTGWFDPYVDPAERAQAQRDQALWWEFHEWRMTRRPEPPEVPVREEPRWSMHRRPPVLGSGRPRNGY